MKQLLTILILFAMLPASAQNAVTGASWTTDVSTTTEPMSTITGAQSVYGIQEQRYWLADGPGTKVIAPRLQGALIRRLT